MRGKGAKSRLMYECMEADTCMADMQSSIHRRERSKMTRIMGQATFGIPMQGIQIPIFSKLRRIPVIVILLQRIISCVLKGE